MAIKERLPGCYEIQTSSDIAQAIDEAVEKALSYYEEQATKQVQEGQKDSKTYLPVKKV